MGSFIGKKLELGELAKLSSTSPILQIETLRLRAGKDLPKFPGSVGRPRPDSLLRLFAPASSAWWDSSQGLQDRLAIGKRLWRYPGHCPPMALEVISKQVPGESLTWSQDVGLIGD